MRITFVVLHYKVSSITIECIENLLRQDYENIQIIVVDNDSNNGSIEEIKKEYFNNEKIYIVTIEHNLGFAKANDLGYQIAKHKYISDCIIVINNDLMIEDEQFCRKLKTIQKQCGYDIVGPDIINTLGEHQNPLQNCITDRKQVEKRIWINRFKILLIPVLYHLKKSSSEGLFENSREDLNIRENVPLHGACLIFGKKYISKHEYPFYPDTFLYGEEEILFFLSQKERLRMAFIPELKVKHMEDVSTNSVQVNKQSKRLFELKHSTDSLKVLRRLMNNKM